ncbi:hypothetical protein E2C01_046688 [Portunus trituberculatus]|uniref:Uncharacterized protein n=1 Tax=Portunus trituberculatus TaxID=210409 RepID=A0A5B7FYH3_PORTR|nr:hypothetical protein [Portunus trituberculatus]
MSTSNSTSVFPHSQHQCLPSATPLPLVPFLSTNTRAFPQHQHQCLPSAPAPVPSLSTSTSAFP